MKKFLITFLVFSVCMPGLALAAWDRNYIAVNYKGFPQSQSEITADLTVLSKNFTYLKTYLDLFAPQQLVVPTAATFNMKVAIGLGLQKNNDSPNFPGSYYEINTAIDQAKKYPDTVCAIVVGGENSLGYLGADKLVEYINYIKARVPASVKVTSQQKWGDLLSGSGPSPGGQKLAKAADYLLATIYPYWNGPGYPGGDADKAGAYILKNWQKLFSSSYDELVKAYGTGKIQIGETGWPSAGSQASIDGHYTGIPSQTAALPNEQTYSEQYAVWASSQKLFTYLFSSFDETDKAPEPGGVQAHWGIYTSARQAKWTLGHLPAVSAGTTLWLGTDSPYGALSFEGGTLLVIDPQTFWPNGFDITPGTTSTLDNGGNALTHTGTLSGSGNLSQPGPAPRFTWATAPASRERIPLPRAP